MDSKKNVKVMQILPFLLALAVVPLITIIHHYDCGLESNNWFSVGGDAYDFFLYYKSRALMILGAVILFIILYNIYKKKVNLFQDKNSLVVLSCIAVFAVAAVLSVLMSYNPSDAMWGGYEQQEGLVVLLTYVLLFVFGYAFIINEDSVHVVCAALTIGAAIVGVLGAFQTFGLDYIKSDGMYNILTGMEDSVKGVTISLNFEEGMAYSTLYNPNYTGTYAALLVPLLAGVVIWYRNIWLKIIAFVGAVSLLVTMFAAGSLSGVIGVVAGVVLAVLFLIPAWKRHIKAGCITAGVAVVAVVIFSVVKPEFYSAVYNRLVQSSSAMTDEANHVIENMDLADSALTITSRTGKKARVQFAYDTSFHYTVDDQEYAPESYSVDEAAGTLGLVLSENEVVSISSTATAIGEDSYPTINVTATGNNFTFLWFNDSLNYFNIFSRVDELKDIEHIGFEGNMSFATGRGYIWSRTFPLLPKRLLLGCGADNFVYDFPNNDYVGKQNYKFEGQIMTKPHNMYLQIWVQDGFLALLGLLAAVLLYTIDSFRLYFLRPRKGFLRGIGMCLFFGIAGYMVVGAGNDSTVTVAPVFWGMFGLGFAVNRLVRAQISAEELAEQKKMEEEAKKAEEKGNDRKEKRRSSRR